MTICSLRILGTQEEKAQKFECLSSIFFRYTHILLHHGSLIPLTFITWPFDRHVMSLITSRFCIHSFFLSFIQSLKNCTPTNGQILSRFLEYFPKYSRKFYLDRSAHSSFKCQFIDHYLFNRKDRAGSHCYLMFNQKEMKQL